MTPAIGSTMRYTIESMTPDDWEAVRAIYIEGIATGNATFETSAPSWEKWDGDHRRDCRLVARAENGVIGWAALSPVSSRPVYAGVAEASLYVAERARGQGVGTSLMRALIDASERSGIWTLQSGIHPDNVASLAMHARLGFRVVGRRERIGKLHDTWRDVVLLERRSSTVGIS